MQQRSLAKLMKRTNLQISECSPSIKLAVLTPYPFLTVSTGVCSAPF